MKQLLFTGSSGFLGKNIYPILAKNYTIDTAGYEETNDYSIDLSKEKPLLTKVYDVVFHAAGKAHVVPKSQEEEKAFFDINLEGTKNLCYGLEKSGVPKNFIFVSTVAVYGCESGTDIDETHPLEGTTPYALSKIQAEEFLQLWCKEHDVCLSIIRPSLIAGPNAPGNLRSMVEGIKKGIYPSIAGGKARKSVLMVEDIAVLIPLLEDKGGIYNVCDNTHPSFRQLEIIISQQLNKKRPVSISYGVAKVLALAGDLLGSRSPFNSDKLKKIVLSLTFSNKKARQDLGWEPMDVIENFKI